ncbi:hypothetical protein DID88_003265 [Monilinia fructigena]|uniref:Uncharacterized protein n=1 Tax=Monilinia fructigena TaxID=38457 RepID=A0A395IUU3_9HELO|nr:hypothetical protein DID88_003265 [Monilinia fructigena]
MSTLKSIVTHTPSLPPHFTFAPSTLYLFLADIGHESLFHIGYLLTSPPPPATSTPFLAPLTGTIFHPNQHPTTPLPPTTHPLHLPNTHPLPAPPQIHPPTLLFILKLYPIDAHPTPPRAQRAPRHPRPPGAIEEFGEGEGNGGDRRDRNYRLHRGTRKRKNENQKNQKKQQQQQQQQQQQKKKKKKSRADHGFDRRCIYWTRRGYISFPETIGPKIVVDSIEAEAVAGRCGIR